MILKSKCTIVHDARLGILTGNKMKIRENKWSEQKAGKKFDLLILLAGRVSEKKSNENLV